jgi:hypothetical protein
MNSNDDNLVNEIPADSPEKAGASGHSTSLAQPSQCPDDSVFSHLHSHS